MDIGTNLETEIFHFSDHSLTMRLVVIYFIWVIAIVYIMEALGIDFSIILAGGATLLVAIGLGLQQLFHDALSGLIFFSDNVFQIERVKSEVRRIINREFIKEGIVIPFQQIDVNVKPNALS